MSSPLILVAACQVDVTSTQPGLWAAHTAPIPRTCANGPGPTDYPLTRPPGPGVRGLFDGPVTR